MPLFFLLKHKGIVVLSRDRENFQVIDFIKDLRTDDGLDVVFSNAFVFSKQSHVVRFVGPRD
jgi:hypothetical protein